MPDPAPTTIADILRGPIGAHCLGDDYPRWHQGRGEQPSKTIEEAEHEADLLAKALRRDGSEEAFDLAGVLDGCSPRRRKGDELRQFPQISGGGRPGETRPWLRSARSVEPEDALQVSEEHLDFLSLAA
jgi:hypothetical protein